MTYRSCIFSNFTPRPAPMPIVPSLFKHYYLNKNVSATGNGDRSTPFKSFADYKTLAMSMNLNQQVILEIDDADYYDDIIIENISALSENLFVYAPFATAQDIRFNYTGQPTNVFLEKSQVVIGHIYGNVIMSKESTLICIGEVGTGANGSGGSAANTASTAITFDNRSSLEDMYLELNVFSGTLDFSGIGNDTGTLHLFINNWDPTSLINALATLPDASANAPGKLHIFGQVEGEVFPKQYPMFNYQGGFPTHFDTLSTSLTAGDYTLTLECSDVFNLKTISSIALSREVGVGGASVLVTLPATNMQVNNNRISVTITITAANITELTATQFAGQELQLAVNFRLHYYDGQTNVDVMNSNIHFFPVVT